MIDTITSEAWCVVEHEYPAENQLEAENKFTLNNGKICQSGNFEEFSSGETYPRTHMARIFAGNTIDNLGVNHLANLPNWTRMNVRLNAEMLDLSQCDIKYFHRTLNQKKGFLERNFEIETTSNHQLEISTLRFLSLDQPEIGVIKYFVKSINFEGRISFSPVVYGDFNNADPEWNVLQSKTQKDVAHLWIQTRKTNFQVCEALSYDFFKNNTQIKVNPTKIEKQKVAGFSFGADLKKGESVCVYKFVALLSSLDHPYMELTTRACEMALNAKNSGWSELFNKNYQAWEQKWENSDDKNYQNDNYTECMQNQMELH